MTFNPITNMKTIRCFAVRTKWCDDDQCSLINANSPGQAKMEFIRTLDGCIPDLKFTDVLCRVVGPPQTSPAFQRNAEYRGMPGLRCGQRVRVGDARGVVVGHNSSANFDVLFDDDSPKYGGLRLNVHPSGIQIDTPSTR